MQDSFSFILIKFSIYIHESWLRSASPTPTPLCVADHLMAGSARGGRSLNTPAPSERPRVDSRQEAAPTLSRDVPLRRTDTRTDGLRDSRVLRAFCGCNLCAGQCFCFVLRFFKGAEVKQSFPTMVRAFFLYSRLLASRFTHLHKREGEAEPRSFFYKEVYLHGR